MSASQGVIIDGTTGIITNAAVVPQGSSTPATLASIAAAALNSTDAITQAVATANQAATTATQAATTADQAATTATQALSKTNPATINATGTVKPDGTSIAVQSDGTIDVVFGTTAGTSLQGSLLGAPSGIAKLDANTSLSANSVIPTGSTNAITLGNSTAIQQYYGPGAYNADLATIVSAVSTANSVVGAFNIFTGAPNPGVYPGFTSYGLGAFDINIATNSLASGLVVGEVTAFGYGAAASAATPAGGFATSITAVGYKALATLIGSQVTAVGDQAGIQMTTGNSTVLVGSHAGRCITTGACNVAIGHGAMGGTDTPNTPFPLGTNTITTGSYNHIVGTNAGQQITSGSRNILIGYVAGHSILDGSDNVAFGNNTLQNANSTGALAIGSSALSNYTGAGQTGAIGLNAGLALTTGSYNWFIGNSAGLAETTGQHSIYIGDHAGAASNGANDNVYIGNYAAYSGGNWNSITDNSCVMIGSSVCRDNSVPNTTTITNTVILGAHATGDLSNAIFFGNSQVTTAYIGGTSVTGKLVAAIDTTGAVTTRGTLGLTIKSGSGGILGEFVAPSGTLANYITFTPAVAGSSPTLKAAGSDSGVSLNINAQGGGGIYFANDNGGIANFPTVGQLAAPNGGGWLFKNNNGILVEFQTPDTTSALANYFAIIAAKAGGAIILGAQGTDSNISLAFVPKGTGVISLNGNVTQQSGSTLQIGSAYTAGTVSSTGYIQITDSSGTVRKVLCA